MVGPSRNPSRRTRYQGTHQIIATRSCPETASGFAKSMGAIKFDLNGRHSSLAHIAWNQNSMLYTFDEDKRKFGEP